MTARSNGYTRSAIAGVAWNYAGAGVLVVTQIASTSITARLISPSEFGAYATAQAAAGLFGYFTLAAVAQGVLRRPVLGPKTIGTATSLSLAASVLISAALWLLAPAFAHLWHVPAAADLIHVTALTLFFSTAAVVPLAVLRRQLRFRAGAFVETGTQVLGSVVGIALAIHLHSAIALALGQTVAAVSLLAGASALVFRELGLAFDRADARELFTFSGQVTFLNFSSYVMNTAPGWFAARSYGAASLGVVSRATLIVGLPQTYLSFGLMKVLYPLYGRVRDDESRVKALVSEALTLSTAFVWPLFALLAGAAPVVVRLLLGPGWSGTAPLIALFALAACAGFPCGLLTNAGEAFGWMRSLWGRQIALFAMLAAVFAMTYIGGFGLEPLIAGVAVAQWIAYCFTLGAFVRRGYLDAHSLASMHAVHGILSLLAFAAAGLSAHSLHSAPLVVQIGAQVCIAAMVFLGIFRAREHFPGGRVLARRLEQAGLSLRLRGARVGRVTST